MGRQRFNGGEIDVINEDWWTHPMCKLATLTGKKWEDDNPLKVTHNKHIKHKCLKEGAFVLLFDSNKWLN